MIHGFNALNYIKQKSKIFKIAWFAKDLRFTALLATGGFDDITLVVLFSLVANLVPNWLGASLVPVRLPPPPTYILASPMPAFIKQSKPLNPSRSQLDQEKPQHPPGGGCGFSADANPTTGSHTTTRREGGSSGHLVAHLRTSLRNQAAAPLGRAHES